MASINRKRIYAEPAAAETVATPAVEEYDETEGVPDEPVRSAVVSGWAKPRPARKETVKAPYLDLSKGEVIIKLLDGQPAHAWNRHFVKGLKPVPFVNCPFSAEFAVAAQQKMDGVECPLCNEGSYASEAFMVNVVDLAVRDTVCTWTFNRTAHDTLEDYAIDFAERRNYGLDSEKIYFRVFQTEDPNGKKTLHIIPVKATDLVEDYNVKPLAEVELEALTDRYDDTSLWVTAYPKLVEISLVVRAQEAAKKAAQNK